MRLGIGLGLLDGLSSSDLRTEILIRREAIRGHRDAVGDERCWLDDYAVWQYVIGLPTFPTTFDLQTVMARCRVFHATRGCNRADPTPFNAIKDKRRWDDDLPSSHRNLVVGLNCLQMAILSHQHTSLLGGLTPFFDRRLYDILPEKIPADFRLPSQEEFLGEKLAPGAGCPAFWRSHELCRTSCDLGKWGPCLRGS